MVFQALKKVFRNPSYFALAFVTSLAVFLFAVWLPNIPLIAIMMGHTGVPFLERINFPISLLGSIATNFTALSASYTIAISVLFGMNLAMMAYSLRQKTAEAVSGGIAVGFFGAGSGVLGMGCAACGSLLFTSALSLFGASGLLAFLPFMGGEFGILGVILLLISLSMTAKQIQNPAVCKI